jgi:beta-lactamase regulating signal transducer with metallopeptidase domain
MKLLTEWAVTSSALILIVLVARYLFREKLSARLRYALWGIVLLRLLVPFQVELPAAPLPVLASNLAPELGEERSIPVFPQGSYAAFGFDRADFHQLEPGEIIPTDTSIGYWQKSQDGETITRYLDLWSPAQVTTAVWSCGAVSAALAILLSNLHFTRWLKKRRELLGNPHPSSPAAMPPSPLGEGLALRGTGVPVYIVEGLPSPCLFGVFQPAVYLTPAAAENPNALRHVLAHELTHRAHFDHIWSLLRCLALALHWYNPLVWLAVVLSKGDGELACDEGAVARLGEAERIPYGRTLVDMVAARSLRPGDLLSCSTAMMGGKKSIQQRIALLVKKPETVKAALFAAIAVVALSAVFVFAGRTQPRPGEPNFWFLSRLELATAIQYGPPGAAFSSSYSDIQHYSEPIADEDLLFQAREALSSFTYLAEDEPHPNLEEGLIHTSAMVLMNDSTETDYTLLWQNGRSYLFPGNMWEEQMKLTEEAGETARLQGVSGTMSSGENIIAILDTLARQQYERTQSDYVPENPLDIFLKELDDAQSIFVDQPAISSANPPGLITDADALSQAKYLLRQGQPPIELPEGVTWEELRRSLSYTKYQDMDQPPGISQEELEHLLFMRGYSITLSKQPQPTSGGEPRYYLAPWENMTLLLRLDAEVEKAPVKVLADYDASLISEMTRLPHLEGPAALRGDLTPEQLRETWTPLLGTPDGPFELGCFFTSSYEDPTQINLKNFLEYCPLAEEVSEQTDQEEYRKVIQASAWAEELANNPDFRMPVPVHRYPREKVSDLLIKYADVAVEELDWKDVLYLEEYDAFYNFTSDQAFGSFNCAGGQIRDGGNSILLWSAPSPSDDTRFELKLQKVNDRYYIRSYHTAYGLWAD